MDITTLDNEEMAALSHGRCKDEYEKLEKERMKEEGEEVSIEKVEAAFRSKPQPGKKREDLNDRERLELTRARNREHAKIAR